MIGSVTHLLDTIPSFDAFARKGFLQSPYARERLWVEEYEAAYRDVFDAFYAVEPQTSGRAAMVRDLSKVREMVSEAAPVMADLIGEVEPAVARALDMAEAPAPHHVLLVGPMSASAVVGRVADQVTLFHCLEWFNSAEGARLLVAHEDAHAFHQMRLGEASPDDAAWTAFYEGVAVQASRAVVPGRPEEDYFWYGYGGFEDWLPWCREQHKMLEERFAKSLDEPETSDTFFGSGLVDGRWRVGFYLADKLVGRLGRPLPELVAMTVDEGRAAIREALGARLG
ncbi:MAG: hypothetical protein ACYC1D_01685 [Acidimicrobiales bacterium]